MCSLLLLLVVAPAAALRGAPLRATTRLDYDHLYHIGSPVDVFKHCVLTALLRRCTEKASPLTYAEAHAGRGLYPFDSEERQRCRSSRTGITSCGRARRAARSFMQISRRISRRSARRVRRIRRPGSLGAARGRPRHLLRTRLRMRSCAHRRVNAPRRALRWRLATATPARRSCASRRAASCLWIRRTSRAATPTSSPLCAATSNNTGGPRVSLCGIRAATAPTRVQNGSVMKSSPRPASSTCWTRT